MKDNNDSLTAHLASLQSLGYANPIKKRKQNSTSPLILFQIMRDILELMIITCSFLPIIDDIKLVKVDT